MRYTVIFKLLAISLLIFLLHCTVTIKVGYKGTGWYAFGGRADTPNHKPIIWSELGVGFYIYNDYIVKATPATIIMGHPELHGVVIFVREDGSDPLATAVKSQIDAWAAAIPLQSEITEPLKHLSHDRGFVLKYKRTDKFQFDGFKDQFKAMLGQTEGSVQVNVQGEGSAQSSNASGSASASVTFSFSIELKSNFKVEIGTIFTRDNRLPPVKYFIATQTSALQSIQFHHDVVFDRYNPLAATIDKWFPNAKGTSSSQQSGSASGSVNIQASGSASGSTSGTTSGSESGTDDPGKGTRPPDDDDDDDDDEPGKGTRPPSDDDDDDDDEPGKGTRPPR
jgi:hypothetical protein